LSLRPNILFSGDFSFTFRPSNFVQSPQFYKNIPARPQVVVNDGTSHRRHQSHVQTQTKPLHSSQQYKSVSSQIDLYDLINSRNQDCLFVSQQLKQDNHFLTQSLLQKCASISAEVGPIQEQRMRALFVEFADYSVRAGRSYWRF